jgi:hypothetical protein
MSPVPPFTHLLARLPGTPTLLALALLLLGLFLGHSPRVREREVLAGVEQMVVTEAGIVFAARLDTGAAISSIHAENIEVVDGDPADLARNKGKYVKFTLVNERKARARLKARIEDVQMIRTGDCREYRYHVYLTVAYRGRGQRVLVNLNNRDYAAQRMLVGRNWLEQGYVVDVSR